MSTDQEREYQEQSAMESKIDSIETQVDEVKTLLEQVQFLANNTYDVIVDITNLFGVTKELIDSLKVRITELEKKS